MTDQEISQKFENKVYRFLSRIGKTDKCTEDKAKPDFENDKIGYVECTVARKGRSSVGEYEVAPIDSKPHIVSDEMAETITDFMCARIANRLTEKQKQLKKHLYTHKSIYPNRPRIVCLTVDLIDFSHTYCWLDFWKDALYKLLYKIDCSAMVLSTGKFHYLPINEDFIKKIREDGLYSDIPIGLFCGTEYSVISGILFVVPKMLRKEMANVNIEYDALRDSVEFDYCDFIWLPNPYADVKCEYLDRICVDGDGKK